MTKGVARYPANFTVLTAPLPVYGFTDKIYDPYYNNVSLLMHFDRNVGSNVFVDSSITPKPITSYGNAHISSVQSKFGSTSVNFSANTWLTVTGMNSELSFGTGDFTVEFWIYPTDVTKVSSFLFGTADAGSWQIALNDNQPGKIGIGRHTVTWDNEFDHGLSNNSWYHIAISRTAGIIYFFVNGTLIGSASNTIAYNQTNTFYIRCSCDT